MQTAGKLTEVTKCLPGAANAAIATARVGPYFDMRDYGARRIVGRLISGALANGVTLTVQLLQATSSGGAGAKNLATTEYVTDDGDSPGNSPHVVSCEASDSDLDNANGFHFVAVRVLSSSAAAGAGLIELGQLRFSPAT